MKGHLLVGSSPLGAIVHVLREIRGKRILDVGCGCGIYGYLLRNKWLDVPPGYCQLNDFRNRDVTNDQPEFLAGIDIQTESARRCVRHQIYDFIALARADNLPFPDNYVDMVLAVEVLEHLTEPQAFKALEEFERVATQRIVITVPVHALSPNGHDERAFLDLDVSDSDVKEFVGAQTHKSEWESTRLRSLGFRVGREVRRGPRGVYDLGVNFWMRYRLGQLVAVKELGGATAKPIDPIPPSPRMTEGIPDYR